MGLWAFIFPLPMKPCLIGIPGKGEVDMQEGAITLHLKQGLERLEQPWRGPTQNGVNKLLPAWHHCRSCAQGRCPVGFTEESEEGRKRESSSLPT